MALLLSGPEDSGSSNSTEQAFSDPVRAPFLQAYRINALRFLGGIAFFFLSVTSPPPTSLFIDVLFEIVGAVAIFTAIAGRAWCLLYIGGRKNSELVTAGPYSMTRNPLYFFSLVGIAGVGANTGSLLLTIVFVAATYAAFSMAMRGEEQYLASRYGPAFAEYTDTVPRLLPDFALWHENRDVLLRSGNAIGSLRDGIVFVVAWLTLEFVKVGQATGILPIFWQLPI